MAKHWSTEVYVLTFYTKETNGSLRMRASWSKNRNKLAKMAADMPKVADPILYNGFGPRLSLSVIDDDDKPKAKKKPAEKPAKRKPVAVAA